MSCYLFPIPASMLWCLFLLFFTRVKLIPGPICSCLCWEVAWYEAETFQ